MSGGESIIYTSPIARWFWEGGVMYVAVGILAVLAICGTIIVIVDFLNGGSRK